MFQLWGIDNVDYKCSTGVKKKKKKQRPISSTGIAEWRNRMRKSVIHDGCGQCLLFPQICSERLLHTGVIFPSYNYRPWSSISEFLPY